jgi:xylono-1,5-lactonase
MVLVVVPRSHKPALLEAEHVCSVGAELGEGPIWVERDSALWFVDIMGGTLRRYDPATERQSSWQGPSKPSFVLPLHGGGFVVGAKSGLHTFDPQPVVLTHLATVEPQAPQNRLNDASVGPDGCVWFGSMDDLETNPTGSLYRLDAQGRCSALDSGYVITNGPAFSPDASVFYHTDTLGRVVYAFDHSRTGKLSGKRVFVRIAPADGYPDGTTVDAEGCVWIALWAGWGVRRYSPDGELLSTVRVRCANVTKIAFGGGDGRTAFVTTAWKGLSPGERAAQPLAGDLFRFRADVPGLPCLEAQLSQS